MTQLFFFFQAFSENLGVHNYTNKLAQRVFMNLFAKKITIYPDILQYGSLTDPLFILFFYMEHCPLFFYFCNMENCPLFFLFHNWRRVSLFYCFTIPLCQTVPFLLFNKSIRCSLSFSFYKYKMQFNFICMFSVPSSNFQSLLRYFLCLLSHFQ